MRPSALQGRPLIEQDGLYGEEIAGYGENWESDHQQLAQLEELRRLRRLRLGIPEGSSEGSPKMSVTLAEVIGRLPLRHIETLPAPAELRKNRARPGPPNSAGGTR